MGGVRATRFERREALLDLVGRLVADEGLAAVTMERVAVLADVSKPVLYRHFSGRGQLLTALLERCWHVLDAVVQARLREARTLDESLAALVTGYFDELDRQGPLLQLMVTGGWHSPAVEQARRRRHRAAEQQWSTVYQQRLGLPAAVADPAAVILRNALQGAAAFRIDNPEHDRAEVIDTYLAIMRAGLERLRRAARTGPSAPITRAPIAPAAAGRPAARAHRQPGRARS
jgi:AcrR family transcriptional regulator